jgi:integrase
MSSRDGNARSGQRPSGHLVKHTSKDGRRWWWYAKTRVPGRKPEQTMRKLGAAHDDLGRPLGKRAAQAALEDLLVQERENVKRGVYGETMRRRKAITFGVVAEDWLHYLTFVKRREASTLRDYRGSLDEYLLPRWGQAHVWAVQPSDVAELRDLLLGRGLSPRTVVRHMTVASGVFRHAIRTGHIEKNPASADFVDYPTVRYDGDFDCFDLDELHALVRHALTEQDGIFFLTAAMTGLRLGELLALKWLDVDFAGSRITVRRSFSPVAKQEKTPKSGRIRTVPLVPDLVGPLDKLSCRERFTGEDDLVFCSDVGEHLDSWSLRRRYKRALAAAGLREIRLHDLRHIFGSKAIQKFAPSDVQAMTGHSSYRTTARYVHHVPRHDDAARLSAAFHSEEISPLADSENVSG